MNDAPQYATANAVDTLARTIWGEARGEGIPGMEAVASVILNRTANPSWWGHDIVSVCLQPWQFSCWNDGDPNKQKLHSVSLRSDPDFSSATGIAMRAVNGELPDPTRGSDSYYALSMPIPPKWATRSAFTFIIGRHAFYRLQIAAPSGDPDATCHSHV